MSNTLARLSQAVQMLAEARTLDEITHVRSIARAAEQYARAEKLGDEAERHAREIRVRAARKAGELLVAMKERGELASQADGPAFRSSPSGVAAIPDKTRLRDVGISKVQSRTWQRLAAVPDEQFEVAVSRGQGEATIAGLYKPRSSTSRSSVVRPEHGKRTGSTQMQSLRGLQQVAAQVQALAEALDGELLGDWTVLHGIEEAERAFEVIETALPVLNARLKRALRDRRGHGAVAAG